MDLLSGATEVELSGDAKRVPLFLVHSVRPSRGPACAVLMDAGACVASTLHSHRLT
jgi:hypothetical protein